VEGIGQSTSGTPPLRVFFFSLGFGGRAALPSACPPDPQLCVDAGAADPDPEGDTPPSGAVGTTLLPERVFPPPVNALEVGAVSTVEAGGL